MDITQVVDIIGRIADGLEEACARCLADNPGVALGAVREQLWAGQDSEGKYLDPTYDTDPFFDEEGFWHHRNKHYKAWKNAITPPSRRLMLGLPPRPMDVPNLFIDGTFYAGLNASRKGMALVIDPGGGNGPDIVRKWGDTILGMGPTAIEFFNRECMLPSIGEFFKDCGYR